MNKAVITVVGKDNLSAAARGFSEIESSLSEIGKEMGVVVHTQKEEIFEMMHRI